MKYSLGNSNFLEEISSLSFFCFPLFLCTDHWGRLSDLSLLFFGTLHSDGYIFLFPLCFWLLFFSQLFGSPPHTAILLFCISFCSNCNRRERGRAQLLKEWHSPSTQHKPIRIKWVQDGGQVVIHWTLSLSIMSTSHCSWKYSDCKVSIGFDFLPWEEAGSKGAKGACAESEGSWDGVRGDPHTPSVFGSGTSSTGGGQAKPASSSP